MSDAKEGYLNTNAHIETKVAMLERALAENQAREVKLRKALAEATEWNWLDDDADTSIPSWVREAIALPPDDSALRELIEAEKADEREACAKRIEPTNPRDDWIEYAKIRAECAAAIRSRNDK